MVCTYRPSNDVIKCSKLKCNFTAKFLCRHFMLYKSIDHRKLLLICFLQQHGKNTSRIFFIFRSESLCVTSDVIFIACTLIDNSYEPISALEFLQLL